MLKLATRKVDIARRVIRQANPQTRVKVIAANVLEPEAAAALLASSAASTDFTRYDSQSRAVSFSTPRVDPACTECGCGKSGRLGHGASGPELPVFAS